MTRFFQQLIARQRGQADTVQPRIPSRFESAVPTAVPTAVSSHQGLPLDGHRDPSANLPSVSQSPNSAPASPPPTPFVQPAEPPANSSEPVQNTSQPSPIFAPVPAPFFVETSPTAETLSAYPTPPTQASLDARLESIARWVNHAAPAFSEPSFTPQVTASEETIPTVSDAGEDRTIQRNKAPTVSSDSLFPPISQPSPALAPDSSLSPNIPVRASVPVPQMPHQPLAPIAPVLSPPSPTIQVSIGRIEIRATVPARPKPSPRPAPTVRRPAVSLEHYLQQRSRG